MDQASLRGEKRRGGEEKRFNHRFHRLHRFEIGAGKFGTPNAER
jgi:hypothetical protein